MKPISPAEPVTDLRRIPVVECGEPMVNYLEHCPDLVWDKPRFKYTRASYVRKAVADMLNEACRRMPNGVRLAIAEGWRPSYIQRRMHNSVILWLQELHPDWSEQRIKRHANRLAAPLHPKVPPPHSTGGAVDLFLVDEKGESLDMQSPYEMFDRRAFPMDAEGLSDRARRNRAILSDALLAAGLTNYPSEYWHWSYGDQGWAYRNAKPHAIYGPVWPEGFVAVAEDDNDLPLERLEE
ncbi:MAG: dipeptidase [Armatimonadetes bacterium]|nr:dipeptidase [Armatimonadota bacterium]